MKIYNEITINMNPESDKYKEVLSEDSYEYSGPLVLASPWPGGGGDDNDDEIGVYILILSQCQELLCVFCCVVWKECGRDVEAELGGVGRKHKRRNL